MHKKHLLKHLKVLAQDAALHWPRPPAQNAARSGLAGHLKKFEFNKTKQEAIINNNYKLLADFKVHDSHYKEVILRRVNKKWDRAIGDRAGQLGLGVFELDYEEPGSGDGLADGWWTPR
jgi:hypothetical protein